MIVTVIIMFILLSLISFILLVRFYPPLDHFLFDPREFLISPNEIQFWIEKVPGRSYYKVLAKYKKSPEAVTTWGHSIFFADGRDTLGFNSIFLNPDDNKIYGGGSEIEKGWEWTFYCLGEGKIEGDVFKSVFPEGTKFTFRLPGRILISSAPAHCIKIYFPGTLKKLEKEELEKGILAEIVEDVTRPKK